MANMIRLDKIKGTAHIVSVKATKDMEVGSIVKLGALASDGETYDVTEPVSITADDQLAMVVPSVLQYDEPRTEEEYTIKAGTVVRAYILEKGDVITTCDSFLTGASVLNQYAVPVNGSFKIAPVATLTGNEVLAFKVDEKGTLGGYASTTLQVVRVK